MKTDSSIELCNKAKNNTKVGAPFIYHDEFICFLFCTKIIFRFHYRQLECSTRTLAQLPALALGITIQVPNYSTIQRRVKDLGLKMNVYGIRNLSTIAIDVTGLTPSNQGQYRRKGRER